MGNYSETKTEVMNHMYARVPLIVIHSSERERVERMLREVSVAMKTAIHYYTDVKQVVLFNSGGEAHRDADRDPLTYAQELFRKSRGSTFAIGDARRVSDENAFSRELLDTLYLAMETSGTLILVTPDYVWNRLAQFGLLTELEYPDMEEREILILRFAGEFSRRYPIRWNEEDIRRAAMMLRGFTEVQINNVLLSVMVANDGLRKDNLKDITAQKSRLYAAVPCVDEVPVPSEMEVSGLDHLKNWIRERKKLFFISDEILEDRHLMAPKGILLAGIPGCGKSFSARVIASEWELPLFRFDIGGVYDKWMGESERRMKDALTFLDNMAPCVVWIDEIEKALSVSDSGNDTGKRVLGQFLYWLQESRERVFLVATANDIMSLPPELFRKGRFSEIFFIDLPNREERKQTIHQYLHSCLKVEADESAVQLMAEETEGFSYADIESCIKEAAQYYLLHPQEEITLKKIEKFFEENIAFAETNPETVKRLREWGSKRAVPASGTFNQKKEV